MRRWRRSSWVDSPRLGKDSRSFSAMAFERTIDTRRRREYHCLRHTSACALFALSNVRSSRYMSTPLPPCPPPSVNCQTSCLLTSLNICSPKPATSAPLLALAGVSRPSRSLCSIDQSSFGQVHNSQGSSMHSLVSLGASQVFASLTYDVNSTQLVLLWQRLLRSAI